MDTGSLLSNPIQKKRKTDAAVELLRIVACLIVIGTHSKLTATTLPDSSADRSVLFLSSFLGEGVGIFFLILGFFYFSNKSTKKLFKRTAVKTVIPALVCVIVTQLLFAWATNTSGIVDSILNSKIKWRDIFNGIFRWTTAGIPGCDHLWFIFTYVQCILWFPLLRYLKNSKKSRYFIIALGLVSAFLSQLQNVVTLPISIIGYNIVPPAVLILLIGNEIYNHREKIRNNWMLRVAGIVLYFVFHWILFLYLEHLIVTKSSHRGSWGDFIPIVSAVGISLFILSFDIKGKTEKIVTFIGKRTFAVYLIHYLINTKFIRSGRFNTLLADCNKISSGFIGEFIYTILSILLVFFISFALVLIYDAIKKILCLCFKKVKECTVKNEVKC
ncbi:MAG: acyltransferase [bacterium]|nr:acyltransferase [bacterium]